jgi:hypothetical protein
MRSGQAGRRVIFLGDLHGMDGSLQYARALPLSRYHSILTITLAAC